MRTHSRRIRLLALLCLAALLNQGLGHQDHVHEAVVAGLDRTTVEGDAGTKSALLPDHAHHEHSSTIPTHGGPCAVCRSELEQGCAAASLGRASMLVSSEAAFPALHERPTRPLVDLRVSRGPPSPFQV